MQVGKEETAIAEKKGTSSSVSAMIISLNYKRRTDFCANNNDSGTCRENSFGHLFSTCNSSSIDGTLFCLNDDDGIYRLIAYIAAVEVAPNDRLRNKTGEE